MRPRVLKRLLAGLVVGMFVAVGVACSSQEAEEPEPEDSPVVPQATASPEPDPTSTPRPAPSPQPTASPVAASETQVDDDPWADDSDTLNATSAVVDGKRYEIVKILSQDAIPAIYNPTFLTHGETENQYRDTDLVIGVSIGGEHRAYHVAYLSAREIVNDVVGGEPIAVTW